MQNLSVETPLNVLITRPQQKGLSLSAKLDQFDIKNQCQPLFDYQELATQYQTKKSLLNTDIVIFVSVAAVEFAHSCLPITQWHYQHIIAVGKATKKALEHKNITNVLTPTSENSEGLLLLPLLNKNLSQYHITIVRGQGGREFLACELRKRKAKVSYLESYQRIWRTLPKEVVKNWQAQQINCIVVTSNELLQRLADIMLLLNNDNIKSQENYWQKQCVWCVASNRIATLATSLNIKNIQVSEGASDEAIILALQQIRKIK